MPFSREFCKALGKKRGWKCEVCGRRWVDGWKLEVHHKIPKSMGGQDTEDNAQILCLGCHITAHKTIELGGRISAQLIQHRLDKTKGRWR